MPENDSIQNQLEQIRKEKLNARTALKKLADDGITLNRPVFFVPGWRDEKSACWKEGYDKKKNDIVLATWMADNVSNPKLAEFVTFTEDESKACDSFFDFAELLKQRIWDKIGKKEEFDLVGHSMGGLDAVAAITAESTPLENVHHLITVATPHRGTELGDIGAVLGPILKDWPPHYKTQCKHLDPDSRSIKKVNTKQTRERLLLGVAKFYSLMGSRDFAVKKSPKFDTRDLNLQLVYEKYELAEIIGAEHSGPNGMTQDPRTALSLLRILTGSKLPEPSYNYGYLIR